jgi:uncharacterized membrane protein YraQ (UPF0718 family)
MEIVLNILTASLHVFREAAFYLLLGFVVAGILRVYIRPESVSHYFHRGRFRSVVYAALVGIPIPL